MGCFQSASQRISPKKPKYIPPEPQGPTYSKLCTESFVTSVKSPQNNDEYMNFAQIFTEISGDIHTIRCPNGMVPPVCLDQFAMPIATSSLELDDTEPVDISLPILSVSFGNDCRVACFAHIQFLSSICYDNEDTSKLIRNVISWLNGGSPITKPLLLYGFPERYQLEGSHSLDESQILYDFGDQSTDLLEYQVIFISTTVDITKPIQRQRFNSFLKNKGGICFFHCPDGPNRVNQFLLDYGLAYSCCNLSTNGQSRVSVEIMPNVDDILPCHLLSYEKLFCEFIKLPVIEPGDLDDLVTALRYHIMVCDERYSEIILKIADSAWQYLETTQYSTEEGIASQLQQSIIIVLLDELSSKLPADKIRAIPDAKKFPGEIVNAELSAHTLEIVLHDESWISTGLWLPAGEVATIKCDEFPPNLHVQVGSHTESLLSKQGPWKRWPDVVLTVDIVSKQTTVRTSFGGIVYLYVSNDDEEEEEMEEIENQKTDSNSNRNTNQNTNQNNKNTECEAEEEEYENENENMKVRITFENFCRYPRMAFEKPYIYEKTKNSGAPWGELSSKSIIITLPSTEMEKIENVDELCAFLDKTVVMVSAYISYKVVRPYRLVFDVEKCDDSFSSEYPIVLLLEYVNDILFNYKTPNVGLFQLIRSLAVVSLPEGCFDPGTEAAIGSLVSTVIFRKFWPGFDVNKLEGIVMPPLFQELWLIHAQLSNQLIPQLLAQSQSPDAPTYDSPEDMWIGFIRDLCNLAKYDLTQLLERARPIPLSLVGKISQLPKCPIRFSE
ncbi:hypothetical protein TRFO_11652 [Tritrichomonas foetus]|uniref:Peptidase M60 domain-containing protein n=1 Tax=Tritrichomonas foetus TaxID=1144522 RepID=A0A1J4J8U8_9EUKA|nr:hypothetical protein TRFO_11652 [Tritrichomonas foetus]|eukprot:OHS93652.1 hypothetical protein TRFO_11652 [Tritrichomonas foetus]